MAGPHGDGQHPDAALVRRFSADEAEAAAVGALWAELTPERAAGRSSVARREVLSEISLLRFVRGHSGDVAKAAAAVRAMLLWRAEVGADAMRERVRAADWREHLDPWRLPHATAVLPHYAERLYHGTDRRGHPLLVTCAPIIAGIAGLMATAPAADYLEYRLARSEAQALLLQGMSEEEGRLIQCIYLWDLAGMTMSHWQQLMSAPCKAYRAGFEQAAARAYPETVRKLVAVNVPWWLEALWR